MSNKRNVKNKHIAPSQDFFTLGSTTSTSTSSNIPQSLTKAPAKRADVPFQAPVMSAKRPKLNPTLSATSASTTIVSTFVPSSPITSTVIKPFIPTIGIKSGWEERAIVVPSTDLREKILDYDRSGESGSEDMIERLLCGSVIQLREQKTKPDSCLVLTLIYLAKVRPLYFNTDTIVEAFASLLKRDALNNFVKTKNSLVPVLVVNILFSAYHDERVWPQVFLNMFIEDSLCDRVWVDNEECKDFVDNLIATFKTRLPPKSMLQASDVINPLKAPDLLGLSSFGDDSTGDDISCSSNPSIHSDQGKELTASCGTIFSRYEDADSVFVINHVSTLINDHLNRRPNIVDISRNMLKLLMVTVGIRSVRLMVIQKLEPWLSNPKLSRLAQDLLLTICLNCNETDEKTLSYLLKMRLKSKTFSNHFTLCFKELINKEQSTFDMAFRYVVNNEMTQVRNMNNLQLISIIFHNKPDRASILLAKEILSFIFHKDDHLRPLRFLLREIARTLRHEYINFSLFVETLLTESKKQQQTIEFSQFDDETKKRTISIIIDIVTMMIFVSVSPTVREAFSTTKIDRREIIRNFQMQIASIQCMTVEWLYQTAGRKLFPLPENFKPFAPCLNKVLFFENLDLYCKLDNWPPENDRNFVFRLVTEVPLYEATLLNIFTMASAKDIPFTLLQANEISYGLIQRTASIYSDPEIAYPVFLINDHLLVLKMLFDNCAYSYPESTIFPIGYIPPKFAIAEHYWRAWIQIFILSAHLPSTFGTYVWEHFPLFRVLVEMAITNCFHYPPKSNEDYLNKELQFSQIERVRILEFENYLAVNHEINESNSYLINTLITLDPTCTPRRPPAIFLDDLKSKCQKFRLYHLLYQCRQPDFLLTIIEQQQRMAGPQAYLTPMTWLVELVESNENNFGILPVPGLCEYFFGQIAEELMTQSVSHESSKLEKARKRDKRRKHIRLFAH